MLITLQQLKTSLQAMKTYITGILPTKVSDLTNDSGYLTTETDPTVPSWAKQSNKPSYTASEVGALPDDTVIPTKTSDLQNDSGFGTYSKPSGGIPSSDMASAVQTSLGKADTAYQKPSGGIPSTDIASGVIPDVSGKADKVSNPTSGNFASLDSNGNIADSGHKHSDYLTSHQDISGKADKVSSATNGNFAGLDSNGNLTDSGSKASDFLTSAPVTDVQVNGSSVLSNGVANVPLATDSSVGVVRGNTSRGVRVLLDNSASHGSLFVDKSSVAGIKNAMDDYRPIVPSNQHAATFYGLAKAAGDSTQKNSDNEVGTYTDDAKSAIKSMLGFLTDTDYATDQSAGVVRINNEYGIILGQNGLLSIDPATSTEIKSGTTLKPLVPIKQHASVFYGLAKVAGDTTQAASSNAVGTYTEEAKTAIKSMLDISDLDVQINGTSIVNNGVANIPYASLANAGVIKIEPNDGGHLGMSINSAGFAFLSPAVSDEIKAGEMYTRRPIIPSTQHESVFYGLAKASGDTTQSQSSNAVGTYTDAAKTAIQNMLGVSDGYVTKDSINNAGISARTYTDLFNGEFSVTTADTSGYLKPYARASVTGRFNKENMHRVTINGTEYILKTRMWYDTSSSTLKVFEYLGNLNYYIDDVSGVPGGTDSNVPFLIISDLNNNSSIDVLTNTVGTYTIKIEKITETKKQIPASILYNNYYEPILKNDAGGSTYNGFSIGVNELMNKRGTLALGYGNKISDAFSQAFGTRNIISENNSFAFGDKNIINGVYSLAFGQNINIESGTDVGIGFGYGTKVNCNNMVAMGKLNCIANTTFPNWANGTAYKKGDMVVADYGPATGLTWLCTVPHTSAASGTFMQDCQTRYQEIGNMGWIMAPSNGDVAFVIGNGQSENLRSNAMKLDFAGNGFFGGSIYVDCDADSTNGTKLATVDDVPDVQIDGTSIVSSGVANIPIASSNTYGVIKYGSGLATSNGIISVNMAPSEQIKQGTNGGSFIRPNKQHESVFYGLAKVAGADMANSSNPVGTYTDTAKAAIKSMLGVPNNAYDLNKGTALPANADLNDYITPGIYYANSTVISTIENSPTTSEFKMIVEEITESYGKQIVMTYGGSCYERIFDTTYGETLAWEKVIKDYDYATSTTGGIVKVDATNGIGIESQNKLYINYAPSDLIKSGTGSYRPITPPRQHEAVFYGLAKAAGDTTQSSSSNTVGTYTDQAKTAIKNMLGISGGGGTGAVDDVQVNGTSIVSGGIASIPYASSSNVGLVRVSNTFGTYIDPNYPEYIRIYRADAADIKAGANGSNYALYRPITPQVQKNAVFYGLAQAASDTTQSSSSNSVGEYTEEAKIAIRKMLGIYEDWELIVDYTTTEDAAEVDVRTDTDGQPFELVKMYTRAMLPPSTSGTQDYVKGSTLYKATTGSTTNIGSLSTLRYTSATNKVYFEYHHEIIGGIVRIQARAGSSENNSQNMQNASFPDMTTLSNWMVGAISGIVLKQYNASSTLIPAGTRIQIYGIRK